jgi:molybdopterin synthase catalytic subunit
MSFEIGATARGCREVRVSRPRHTPREAKVLSGIVRRSIDPSKVLESVMDPEAGGIVLFVGTVRNRTGSERVKGLEYEVYRTMAQQKFAELEKEIRRRWPVKSLTMIHREGKLKIGEVSVAVAVSAVHRREAFEAARFAIERIKRSFPIWKREKLEGGRYSWVRGTPIQGLRKGTTRIRASRTVRPRMRIQVEA